MPAARVGSRFESGLKYDSSYKAESNFSGYDKEPYLDKAMAFKPAQPVDDLDEKPGYFETIHLSQAFLLDVASLYSERLSYLLSVPVLPENNRRSCSIGKISIEDASMSLRRLDFVQAQIREVCLP